MPHSWAFSGQVRYGGIRRSSASPRPPCDGTPFGLRVAIAHADARPAMPVSFRWDFTSRNHEDCGRPLGMVQPLGSRQEIIQWVRSSAAPCAMVNPALRTAVNPAFSSSVYTSETRNCFWNWCRDYVCLNVTTSSQVAFLLNHIKQNFLKKNPRKGPSKSAFTSVSISVCM